MRSVRADSPAITIAPGDDLTSPWHRQLYFTARPFETTWSGMTRDAAPGELFFTTGDRPGKRVSARDGVRDDAEVNG